LYEHFFDKAYYAPHLVIYTRLTENAYPDHPTAKFSVVFYIKCDLSLCPSALAYRLWFIKDSCGFLYEKVATLLAVSYVFLDDGVYAFCLYDWGLEEVVNMESQSQNDSNLIIYQSPPGSDLIDDQVLEQRVISLLS
jgi:hypothetical protein